MRKDVPKQLENGRITTGPFKTTPENGFNGFFVIKNGFHKLRVIISDQLGWDHVSVSMKNRMPSWDDMCLVKYLCFDSDETVVQFHPKHSEYINFHPYTLHLWRKHGAEYELPPSLMV